jgi:Peptidase family M28
LKKSALFFGCLFYLGNFLFGQVHSDPTLIKKHLVAITKTNGYRNHQNIALLSQTADYIYAHFLQFADTVYFQEYSVKGKIYKNVIASFGAKNKKRIVVGAHYDVCGEQEGADDNASGVVGLLELARLLQGQPLRYRIDLVAFTLEEPPYFRSEYMGSYIHAKFLADTKTDVFGMLSLEMIGYFSGAKKSQSYPIGLLKLIYGGKGNYITLVKKFGAGKFARKFGKKFKKSKSLETKKFVAPSKLSGIDFSDHLNYWKFGFSALMLTDTAFYRNKNYHEKSDKMETLDIGKMAKVIEGVFGALTTLN